MSFKIKAAGSAALAALFVSSTALAQTVAPSAVLYGGGATLPATAYNGNNIYDVTPTARLSAPLAVTSVTNPGFNSVIVDPTSLFGTYKTSPPARGTTSRPDTSYCATGSGQGRRTFIGVTGGGTVGGSSGNNFADGICRDYGSSQPAGFSAPAGQVAPHFAASDQPLSATELTTFAAQYGATRGAATQIPVLAGAIAVTFKNSDIPPARIVEFTESQVCQIFSGAISNWAQLGFPSKAIKVIYRSDGSGTSFSFSNHLSAVCPTAVPNAVAGFSTQGTFNLAFPGGVAGAPTGSIAASGNPGVTNTIAANEGAIGYAELSDGLSKNSVGANSVAFASIKLRPNTPKVGTTPPRNYVAFSPLALKAKYKLPTGSVLFDKVVGSNDSNGRPTLLAAGSAQPNCLILIDPNAYATATKKTAGAQDYTGYPIVAITSLLAYYSGNGVDSANIGDLLASAYYGPVKGSTMTVGAGTGFALLSTAGAITRTTVKACVTP